MNYRTDVKLRQVYYIDISQVPLKHLEWFLKGVTEAHKQIKSSK